MFLLWSAVRGAGRLPSTRTFCAYLVIGWGAFNLIEGIINHHVLALHPVRDVFPIVGGVGFIVAVALRDNFGRAAPLQAERRSGLERRSVLG